ncbi:glycosyltransferase family 4 protein [Phenylobacterium sp.]|uniref:glycosyltransferase family 4 protein n=1 Tax=Phenylobacterium sp. TaxID=1871053 RepID=UPI0025D96110|nr:glycosyltransferase family 4 protein [Phenylobacterium sp.]
MSVRSSVEPAATAVIRAEPDAYNMAKERLMGRQAAGHGFLRAAVQARGDGPIYGLANYAAAVQGFGHLVSGIDPQARVEWLPFDQLSRIGEVGVLYLADVTLAQHARLRLRAGVGAFSLCGVTHTTASGGAMDEIVNILREPVMPWDALVCTSSAVVETVRRVHEAEADYLRWRHGAEIRLELPQLPIVPLGVHCADFEISPDARAVAREALALSADTVTALFVGRLVFHAKAHPFALYRGLQAAAERTGRPVALLMCGWAPNDPVAEAFATGAAQFAPDVKVLFVEGRDLILRDQAWAAADIFVSLADNIQETFGLTPIEAMAAGLPVVVTDWNGYKDTVRQGVDGYRVRTWTPGPGMGTPLARAHEAFGIDYDRYCWAAAATTAIDLDDLADVLSGLVENADLRRRLGDAGRRRARELYDWPVVYRQYQDLWGDLNARRRAAIADPATLDRLKAAPRAGASRLDPYYAFGHYPTAQLGAATRLSLAPGATLETLRATLAHPLFGELPAAQGYLEALYALIEPADLTLADATTRLKSNLPAIARAAGILAKMGLVRLG